MLNKIRLLLILNSTKLTFFGIFLFTLGLFWLFNGVEKKVVENRQVKIYTFTNQSIAIIQSIKERTGMIQGFEGNSKYLFGYEFK